MSKKERRALRKQRNIEKEISYKKEAWESGKLIEENHNLKDYSKEYASELSVRLLDIIVRDLESSTDNEAFLHRYRSIKNKIRDLLIYWPDGLELTREWVILKLSLETYWDDRDNLKNRLINLISND